MASWLTEVRERSYSKKPLRPDSEQRYAEAKIIGIAPRFFIVLADDSLKQIDINGRVSNNRPDISGEEFRS